MIDCDRTPRSTLGRFVKQIGNHHHPSFLKTLCHEYNLATGLPASTASIDECLSPDHSTTSINQGAFVKGSSHRIKTSSLSATLCATITKCASFAHYCLSDIARVDCHCTALWACWGFPLYRLVAPLYQRGRMGEAGRRQIRTISAKEGLAR